MISFHKLKQDNDQNPAKRNIYKLAMNALTGKFSQSIYLFDSKFFYDDSVFTDVEFVKKIRKVEFAIFDSEIQSYLVYSEDDKVSPTKMNHLGACVLANSRVWMSRITRAIGSYWQPDKKIYYCDTDSLIIMNSSVESMEEELKSIYIGDKLGQLKDELPGTVITRAVFLAPKTYYIEYIEINSKKRMAIVKSKGVPSHPVNCPRGKMDFSKIVKASIKPQNTGLRDVFYSLAEREGEDDAKVIDTKNYIPFSWFKEMYENDRVVISTFGKLNRKLIDESKDNNVGVVLLQLNASRTINKNNWWKKEKRTLLGNYSVPPGHFQVKNIN
jgi:hypothetical protein